MQVLQTPLVGVLLFAPNPHRDERGFFTRTFDAGIARQHDADGA